MTNVGWGIVRDLCLQCIICSWHYSRYFFSTMRKETLVSYAFIWYWSMLNWLIYYILYKVYAIYHISFCCVLLEYTHIASYCITWIYKAGWATKSTYVFWCIQTAPSGTGDQHLFPEHIWGKLMAWTCWCSLAGGCTPRDHFTFRSFMIEINDVGFMEVDTTRPWMIVWSNSLFNMF